MSWTNRQNRTLRERAQRVIPGGMCGHLSTALLPNAYPQYFQCAQTALRLCDETGALLVIDDVRTGFRLALDCSWSALGVRPDLSCWGKCFANCHPTSAVLGAEHLRTAATSIFVTGSFGLAAAPMAAAVATLKLIRDLDTSNASSALERHCAPASPSKQQPMTSRSSRQARSRCFRFSLRTPPTSASTMRGSMSTSSSACPCTHTTTCSCRPPTRLTTSPQPILPAESSSIYEAPETSRRPYRWSRCLDDTQQCRRAGTPW
ncbi:aminotransferase class III-fold pyridoxal phosphate-dependent enzyme [Burkholderia vietnamiensis]|nr:aminotransferase class III-fold pyridoxal phosphate-dependent enzyme [Burkholderia vietnamiensis]